MTKLIRCLMSLTPNWLSCSVRSYLFKRARFDKVSQHEWEITEEFASLELSKCVLMLGHSNPLYNIGGTERVIIQEMEVLLSDNVDFVFIYPVLKKGSFHYGTAKNFRIIVNGFELLEITESELVSFVSKLPVAELRVHHLSKWRLQVAKTVLNKISALNKPTLIYIHDFYYDCPLLGAVDAKGNQKSKRQFTTEFLKFWKDYFKDILAEASQILVPSDFVKDKLPESFKHKMSLYQGYNALGMQTRSKLAYLGAGTSSKGYETWVRLSENALITRRYELIHLGHRHEDLPGVRNISFNFKQNRGCIASSLLKSEKIDAVLLWSLAPETYSFTLHEARAANVKVLTNTLSGNIYAEIVRNPSFGDCFKSELQLFAHLLRNRSI